MDNSQRTVQRPPTSGVPVGMRPPSRTSNRIEMPSTPNKINTVNRSLTVNGLPSAKKHVGNIHVAGKLYFIGILRDKINEICAEINRLSQEIDQRKRGHSIQLHLEESVATLKNEIKKEEEELADYNIVFNHVQNGTYIDEIIDEFHSLEQSNLKYENDVNSAFIEKRNLEKIVLEQEKMALDMIKGHTSPELQKLANEIELIESKCTDLKQTKIDLIGKTRDELLQMVKDATTKIGDTEKLIQDEKNRLQYINKQIKQIEEKESDLQTDRGKKYLKLLQKEKEMNNFIQNYQANLDNTKNNISSAQNQIFETLKKTSHLIESIDDLPSENTYNQIKNELVYKEKQVQNSQKTNQLLQNEVENRRVALERLDGIDIKIQSEIENIKNKIKEMEDEMPLYENIDAIRSEGESNLKLKTSERDELKSQLYHLRKTTNTLTSNYNKTKYEIKTDDVGCKLNSLEKEIRQRASENNAIQEIINENKRLTNYSIIKRSVMNIVNEINNLL